MRLYQRQMRRAAERKGMKREVEYGSWLTQADKRLNQLLESQIVNQLPSMLRTDLFLKESRKCHISTFSSPTLQSMQIMYQLQVGLSM
jgi:hypothetical protein